MQAEINSSIIDMFYPKRYLSVTVDRELKNSHFSEFSVYTDDLEFKVKKALSQSCMLPL